MSNNHTQPHVLPLSVYLKVGLFLIVLTGITVFAAQIDFGPWNLVIAFAIAAFKATLVALYFMHLKYDSRLYSVVFGIGIFLLAVFIIFIMFDTLRRGDLDPIKEKPINPYAIIYDNNGDPIPFENRVFTKAEATIVEEVPFEILHGYGPIKEEVKVGPIDTMIAAEGRAIFKMKCSNCHRLDERYTGPPLRGVTVYRSPTFIMNQILNPQENVTKHPEMQALLAQYYTFMTFQNVTKEDARKLVEYLRYMATLPPGQN
jgi:caa(3)-type oxidase subunit IV